MKGKDLIALLFILLIFVMAIIAVSMDVVNKKLAERTCEEKGYDGMDIIDSDYRCYKVVDGFYEYSAALHLGDK